MTKVTRMRCYNFHAVFLLSKHEFTGVDYVEYYGDIIRNAGADVEIIFANSPLAILDYTKNVLVCDIHTMNRTKKLLKNFGAEIVYGLDDILNKSIDGSGYNSMYGLLGSNKSTEDTIKLFPNNCDE